MCAIRATNRLNSLFWSKGTGKQNGNTKSLKLWRNLTFYMYAYHGKRQTVKRKVQVVERDGLRRLTRVSRMPRVRTETVEAIFGVEDSVKYHMEMEQPRRSYAMNRQLPKKVLKCIPQATIKKYDHEKK